MHVRVGQRQFLLLTAALLVFAVFHTLWATSLDGFTIDEAYHITAGATYLRWGDYRINPEHPPLVKLAAALAEPAAVLHLAPFTPLNDKYQERVYTQTAVFKLSDYRQVHRHARFALITLNTLLLALLTLALRRVFSPSIALGVLLWLALDPTVAAHMPVVMTDLPLALIGTLTCALAVLALRCRRWLDWLLFGLAFGLTLGTKHSAPLILLPLLLGCAGVLLWQGARRIKGDTATQLGRLVAAALLGVVVLWSLYGFRFHESRERDAQGHFVETYNRPLDAKINDLRSPLLRASLTAATKGHLLPRAYLWGFADTLRAGVEGRPALVRAFGRDYIDKAPWWIAGADLLVKVPLPFLVLALAGLALFAMRRLPADTARPMTLFVAMLVFFMSFISLNGVFYAGLRHWLFAVPLLAIPAAACMIACLEDRRLAVRAVPVLALLLIAVPTLPQRRIWEYHNILVGGSGNAWKYFLNESVDLGQRSDELYAFANRQSPPAKPINAYWLLREATAANGVHIAEPAPEEVADGYLSGWFFFNGPAMPIRNWKHIEVFRTIAPTARFGNAFVYRGRFFLPHGAGAILISQGFRQLEEKGGDKVKAELYLKRGVQLDTEASGAFIELGNFALERKDKAEALRQYQAAVKAEQYSETVRQAIRDHIAKVEANPVGAVGPMRRPNLE